MVQLRIFIIAFAFLIAFWLFIGHVRAAADPVLPHGATCDTIRHYVGQYGRVRAIAWAVKQGYGVKDIAAARACLVK